MLRFPGTRLVSVPWSGFINRKLSLFLSFSFVFRVSVPWSGFINRKFLVLDFQFPVVLCFSPVVGIY